MRARPLAAYFVAVFAITWSIAAAAIFASSWFARTFGQLDTRNPAFFLGVYAPSIVGILLTGFLEGASGLKRLFARLDPRRCHPIWYLVVIGGFLVLTATAAGIGRAFGRPVAPTHFAGVVGILAAGIFLDPGPLGEELGWRGFALPRMLERKSPLVATLGLGIIWGLWHLPAFFVSTLSQSQLSLPVFLLGAVSLSVVVGWLFLRSNGSVLITILAHAMANHAGDVTGATFGQLTGGLTVVAIGLVVTGQLESGSGSRSANVSGVTSA
jgi:hypothetical protein